MKNFLFIAAIFSGVLLNAQAHRFGNNSLSETDQDISENRNVNLSGTGTVFNIGNMLSVTNGATDQDDKVWVGIVGQGMSWTFNEGFRFFSPWEFYKSATPPTNVTARTYYNTDTNIPYYWNGGAWTEFGLSSIPNASITAAKMANADHGDVSWSEGVATIDNNVITGPKINDGTLGTVELNITAGTDADGKILASDGSGGFKYVVDQTGGGSSGITVVDSTGTTLSPSDVHKNNFLYRAKNANTISVAEPSGSYSAGDTQSFLQDSTGVLQFDFRDIRKDVYWATSEEGQAVTFHYDGSTWSPLVYNGLGTWTPITNYYDLANAANPDNEVDATAGVIPVSSEFTITSESSPVDTGSYSLQFVKNTSAGVNASATIQLSGLTVGVSYTFTFKAYVSTPGDANNNYVRSQGLYDADWSVSNQVEVDPGGSFVEYSFVSTPAVTNPRLQVTSSTVAVNVPGTTIHMDSFNIVKTP